MNDIDLFALNSMIIGCFAIFVLIIILLKKIDFNKYVPGLICIIIVFIVEVFEIEIYEEFFDFFEYAGILSGAILLLIAALLEYYKSKRKVII
ncbi:MAG: hypothetical protein ACFFAH_10705 [Promethearchaeota archaeon]